MISQRIKQIIDNENLSIRKFEEKISCTQGIITKCIRANTDISSKVISSIIRNFPQYSALWLLTGEGEMLVSTNVTKDEFCKQEMDIDNDLGEKFYQRLVELEDREFKRDFTLNRIADTLCQIQEQLKQLNEGSRNVNNSSMCG